MRNASTKFDLPGGWSCRVELKPDIDGAISVKAELLQKRDIRCVFVLANQPTPKAALDRTKRRAGEFIAEWESRQRETR